MTDDQISTHTELFDLTGKNALVTGGTRGIGMMMARGLLQAGARVVISSRKADACESAKEELSQFGDVKAIPADLSQHEECRRLADWVTADSGSLHILVNNAGATWGEALETFPDSAWDKVLDLNVKSPFWLVQALLPALRQAGTADDPARIINVGSIDGIHVSRLPVYSYASSKAAIHQLTRVLARELGPTHHCQCRRARPVQIEDDGRDARCLRRFHCGVGAAAPHRARRRHGRHRGLPGKPRRVLPHRRDHPRRRRHRDHRVRHVGFAAGFSLIAETGLAITCDTPVQRHRRGRRGFREAHEKANHEN